MPSHEPLAHLQACSCQWLVVLPLRLGVRLCGCLPLIGRLLLAVPSCFTAAAAEAAAHVCMRPATLPGRVLLRVLVSVVAASRCLSPSAHAAVPLSLAVV